MGYVYYDLGKNSEKKDCFRKAYSLLESLPAEVDNHIDDCLNELTAATGDCEEFQLSLQCAIKCFQLRQRFYPAGHFKLMTSQENLWKVLYKNNYVEDALRECRAVLLVRCQQAAQKTREWAKDFRDLFELLERQPVYTEVIPALEEIKPYVVKLLGIQHFIKLILTYKNVENTLLKKGLLFGLLNECKNDLLKRCRLVAQGNDDLVAAFGNLIELLERSEAPDSDVIYTIQEVTPYILNLWGSQHFLFVELTTLEAIIEDRQSSSKPSPLQALNECKTTLVAQCQDVSISNDFLLTCFSSLLNILDQQIPTINLIRTLEEVYPFAVKRLGENHFLIKEIKALYSLKNNGKLLITPNPTAALSSKAKPTLANFKIPATPLTPSPKSLELQNPSRKDTEFYLGRRLQAGLGKEDQAVALTHFKKAAEKGDLDASVEVGICYEEGQGVEKNLKLAFKNYERAADKGHPRGMRHLGYCYFNGQGVTRDVYKALRYWNQGAEKEEIGCLTILARIYASGLLKEAPKDMPKAIDYFRRAAACGDAAANHYLAYCYRVGKGVEKNKELAFQYEKIAVARGFSGALVELGCLYANGEGIETNLKEAASCFIKAAENGDPEGQYFTGLVYSQGDGVPADAAMAVKYYQQAADQNYGLAQLSLASCYERGQGVVKNLTLAQKYYRLAAAQGFKEAEEALKRVLQEL